MDTTRLLSSHPSGDMLEQYALGLLSENRLAQVETHLLICHECQDALSEADDFVAVMKAALAEPTPQPARSRWAAFADSLRFSRPIPAFAGALAALSLAAILMQTYVPGAAVTEAEITLRSVRGGPVGLESEGPANSSLNLKIASQHLSIDEHYHARIVDAAGRQKWEGSPELGLNDDYLLHVAKPLAAGSYWVRLYDPQQELLQEYGLRLQ